MVDEEGQKEEQKFDFDAAGEVVRYISLDQARVLAMRTSSATPGEYSRRFAGVPMAFEVVGEEETEDHYVITLSFRPQGRFVGATGQEQFFIEKEGDVAYRQVLSLPEAERQRRFPVVPVLIAVVLVAIAGGVGALLASGTLGGGSDDTTPVPVAALAATAMPTSTATPFLEPTATPVVVEVIMEVPVVVTATPVPAATAAPVTAVPTPGPAVSIADVTAAEIEALVKAATERGASAEEIEALVTIVVEQAAAEAAIPLSASELESIVVAAVGAIATPVPVVTAVPVVAPTATPELATAVAEPAVPTAPVQVVQARGTFNYYHPQRWGGDASLDPAVRQRWEPVTEMVYDRLIRLDQSGRPQPVLAESWEVRTSPPNWSWTFNIRNGVTFSDGRPLTAKDVHYTFQHYLNPDVGSPLAQQLNFIDTGRLELIDQSTFRINLAEPHGDLALSLSNVAFRIIPEGSNPGGDGIGTGPFTVESLDFEGVSTLVSHDDYWRGRPGLEGIRLFGIADAETQMVALLAGRIDMLRGVRPDQVQLFGGNPNFVVQENPTGPAQNISMIVTEPPFDDIRVRQALKLVVDSQEMIEVILQGHGTPACNNPVRPIDQYYWGQDCSQDIEKAKQLLAEAGYPDGLTIEMTTSGINPYWLPIAEMYLEYASRAGIEVNVTQVPAEGYWTNIWRVHPFANSWWSMRYADQMLNLPFRCGANFSENFWCNEEFERVMDAARSELTSNYVGTSTCVPSKSRQRTVE